MPKFQHTAARRRLVAVDKETKIDKIEFQHTAARRRLGLGGMRIDTKNRCFNTQPPEGGWDGRNLDNQRFL